MGRLGADGGASFSLDTRAGARSFFLLGIDHVRFGPDHLLFLLVLTLAVAGTAVTRATTWRTVKLVTAFTAGHAISLSLAYFHVISVPADVVEPAISLSIVAAAVIVLAGRSDAARPGLAALVGLVHGLGFASSLATLGVASAQRTVALAAFNVGIDVAQTAVVLTAVAVLWIASKALVDRMAWVRIPDRRARRGDRPGLDRIPTGRRDRLMAPPRRAQRQSPALTVAAAGNRPPG